MTEPATAAPQPTTSQMRAYLRAHRPDIKVGRRGFLSQYAKDAYWSTYWINRAQR